MKLSAIADIHAHNAKRMAGQVERSLNRRCRDTLSVLERAYKLAAAEGCEMMLMLGDLVDSTMPEPQLIAELLRIVHDARVQHGIVTLLLVGNHDQHSDQEGDHALAPFLPFPEDAVVVGEPSAMRMDGFDLVMLPHAAAPAAPARLKKLLSGLPAPTQPRVLLMHAGVSDEKTAPFLKGVADSVDITQLTSLALKAGVEVVLAGNWHDHRRWGEPKGVGFPVVQVGALVPTGFDNPGLTGYGGVAILDTDTMDVRMHHLDGPRFVPVRGLADLKKLLAPGAASPTERRLYVKATVDPDDLKLASAVISAAHASGQIASGEVIPDGADRIVEARKAASAARSADTLAGALDRFVSEMPLEENVSRAEVLEKARGYLKSGG